MIDCELNEEELAETLGMKRDSMFVKQMFQHADTDQSGYLSMREFADLVVLLMNGRYNIIHHNFEYCFWMQLSILIF